MSTSKPVHPIRRIRQALKATPEEMGLRQFATSAGFSKFLGCSSSLIRNVECGITANWRSLAERIERKTKVSSAWLLDNPGPEDPILDIRGRPWSPSRELDPLRPRPGMPDWRILLNTSPGALPDMVATMVKAQLALELSFGSQNFLADLLSLFGRYQTFENPVLQQSLQEASQTMRESLDRALWRKDTHATDGPDKEMGYGLALLMEKGAKELTLETMGRVLNEEGFGWAAKLRNADGTDFIKDIEEHYDWKFPSMWKTGESNADAELD